ncbi:MAG: oligopeptide:H+ symporter [Myxococcales bacterium]|nr:oligopeptide:H+ symporter [Myxococcales bacterium]
MSSSDTQPTLLGHPTGLYALFFAEMWERFSFYGMRALLVFFMLKGFLAYGDDDAYRIYAAYAALVYMTPFFGGMIADRLLGARRAVVLGGLLMSGGHLLMTIETAPTFYTALALLVVGNGFFKPNISSMVGTLYAPGSSERDGGFTIFYMGINLGAAMAPLLCGYVGETYGWHLGFGLATIGMLLGLAVFVVPTMAARILIVVGAVATAAAMVWLQESWLLLVVNGFVALALVASGVLSFVALGKQGLDPEVGGPPDPELLKRPVVPGVSLEVATYLGALVVVPIGAFLLWSNRTVTLIPDAMIATLADSDSLLVNVAGTVAAEISTPTGLIMLLTGVLAVAYILFEAVRRPAVEGQRLIVALTLMGFSLLFWTFFDQGGSSVNNFTDRNVDRVYEERVLTEQDVGQTLTIEMTQEQLGYRNQDQLITLDVLDAARKDESLEVDWVVDAEDVGMGIGGTPIPASTFQSANPIFILLFGLPLSLLWSWLAQSKLEPSTPVKFSLGLLQLGLGFGLMWYGATNHDPRGMVGVPYLVLGYLLHTTGELCLSPVGLSMITRLSPAQMVSTMMGGWFLATAFSGLLGGIIAVFTSVGSSGATGEAAVIPPPIETVMVYGNVFGSIAIAALLAAVVLLALSPLLKRGMHGEQ